MTRSDIWKAIQAPANVDELSLTERLEILRRLVPKQFIKETNGQSYLPWEKYCDLLDHILPDRWCYDCNEPVYRPVFPVHVSQFRRHSEANKDAGARMPVAYQDVPYPAESLVAWQQTITVKATIFVGMDNGGTLQWSGIGSETSLAWSNGGGQWSHGWYYNESAAETAESQALKRAGAHLGIARSLYQENRQPMREWLRQDMPVAMLASRLNRAVERAVTYGFMPAEVATQVVPYIYPGNPQLGDLVQMVYTQYLQEQEQQAT